MDTVNKCGDLDLGHLVSHLPCHFFKRVGGISALLRVGSGDGDPEGWRIRFHVRTAPQEATDIRGLPLVSSIGFLEKEIRLTATCGLDAKQVDSNAVLLRLLDPHSDVFVTGKQHTLRHGPVTGERDHVSYDERIDALLLAPRVHEAESDLDARLAGECDVLGG